jgi:hypothetical protein
LLSRAWTPLFSGFHFMSEPIPLQAILAQVFRQMDPESCLQRAAQAIAAADYAEARLALSDYRAWRARGGFEPTNGDQRADELERHLLACRKTPTNA